MKAVQFNTSDIFTPPGDKFERDAACSTEKVKNPLIIQIVPIIEDVKKIFPGEVCRWPSPKVFTRTKSPAFKNPSNYSHL